MFARDGHRCRRCGREKNVQWSHVFSRRFMALRWDLLNSMALCAGCHLWWHHQPLESAAWCENILGAAAIERLRMIMKTPRRPDLAAIRLYLEAELKKYAA